MERGGSDAIEQIYDCIMDLVLEAKQVSLDNSKKENVQA